MVKTLPAFLYFVTTIAFGASAWAGGLLNPMSIDSAAVVPKGVRNLRVTTFTTQVSEKYNGSGNTQALAAGFNKPVTWNTLTEALSEDERVSLKGYLASKGIDGSQEVGQSRGVVNSRLTGTVPVFALGVTDKLTMAVAVPILYSYVNVDSGWESNENMQKLVDGASKEGIYNKIAANKEKLDNVVQTKVSGQGYEELRSENKTEVGDVNLVVKMQPYKNDRMAFAIQQKVVLPTGRTANVNKVVDIASGSGQYNYTVGGVADFYSGKATLTPSLSYTRQFPTTTARRIPTKSDESTSSDVDMNVSKDEGDIFAASLGLKYSLARTWTIGAAVTSQYKESDRFAGSAFSSDRYRFLETDTEQTMQSYLLSTSFSTVPLYMAKQFAVPLDATLNYSQVIAGRNVNIADLWIFELSMYF